jgi:hypothetical protein
MVRVACCKTSRHFMSGFLSCAGLHRASSRCDTPAAARASHSLWIHGAIGVGEFSRCADAQRRRALANARRRVRARKNPGAQQCRMLPLRRAPATGLCGTMPALRSQALSTTRKAGQTRHIGQSSATRILQKGHSSRNIRLFTVLAGSARPRHPTLGPIQPRQDSLRQRNCFSFSLAASGQKFARRTFSHVCK